MCVYTYMYTYIYIYIYTHTYIYKERERERDVYIYLYMFITVSIFHVRALLSFQQPMYKQTQNTNVGSAAHVVGSCVSSEILKCRLLK